MIAMKKLKTKALSQQISKQFLREIIENYLLPLV